MGRVAKCKICGKTRHILKKSKRCLSCAMNKLRTVNKQLRNHKGKYYKVWKHNLLSALKKR